MPASLPKVFRDGEQLRYDPADELVRIGTGYDVPGMPPGRMSKLRILHLSDGRPGHYHLSEGVIAAIGRLRETHVETRQIKRRWIMPARALRFLIERSPASPQTILSLGYGLGLDTLPLADLVISAGGQTLPANMAASRLLGAANIFVGSLRGMDPENFSLIVSSYARHAGRPRHLVTLKPSAMDPDTLNRHGPVKALGPGEPPRLAGLLIGGDSGLFSYRDDEWHAVFDFMRAASRELGVRWLVSTSRRTAPHIAQAAFDLAKDKDTVADFLDYKLAGPGSLNRIMGKADAILCSEDSSTMMSEAVWARLPVIGFSPENHSFKPEEEEYRKMMLERNWCRFMPVRDLSPDAFLGALAEIEPLKENPLDRLAGELGNKLPGLTDGQD